MKLGHTGVLLISDGMMTKDTALETFVMQNSSILMSTLGTQLAL